MRIVTTSSYVTPDIGQAIGAVAVHWSALEYELEVIIRHLARTPLKVTRILVTGMNAKTRLLCIESFLQLRRAPKARRDEFKTLIKDLTKIEEGRNKVIHGLWHRDKNGNFHLVRTSGAWEAPKVGRVRRSVLAELEPLNSANIRATQAQILSMIRSLREWRARL